MQLLDVPTATGLIGATCIAGDFAAALARVSRATAARPVMPVLSHVLIDATGGTLRLSATDLSVHASTNVVPATVSAPGTALVPARLLADLVKAAPPGDQVTLAGLDGHAVRLRVGSATSTVKGADPAEFPPFAATTSEAEASVPGADLRDAVARVAVAAATDEARPVLAGVHVRIGGGTATFEAADGFRLARWEVPAPSEIEGATPIAVIVHAKSFGLLVGAASASGAVHLAVNASATHLIATYAGAEATVIATRLLEGVYPDLARVIPPTDGAVTMTAPREAWAHALRVARVVARDVAEVVAIDASPGGMISLGAEAAEVGKVSADLVGTVAGGTLSAALNARYMLDAIAGVGKGGDDEAVTVAMASATSPALVTGAGGGAVHVVMPMHRAGT